MKEGLTAKTQIKKKKSCMEASQIESPVPEMPVNQCGREKTCLVIRKEWVYIFQAAALVCQHCQLLKPKSVQPNLPSRRVLTGSLPSTSQTFNLSNPDRHGVCFKRQLKTCTHLAGYIMLLQCRRKVQQQINFIL